MVHSHTSERCVCACVRVCVCMCMCACVCVCVCVAVALERLARAAKRDLSAQRDLTTAQRDLMPAQRDLMPAQRDLNINITASYKINDKSSLVIYFIGKSLNQSGNLVKY